MLLKHLFFIMYVPFLIFTSAEMIPTFLFRHVTAVFLSTQLFYAVCDLATSQVSLFGAGKVTSHFVYLHIRTKAHGCGHSANLGPLSGTVSSRVLQRPSNVFLTNPITFGQAHKERPHLVLFPLHLCCSPTYQFPP